MKKVFLSVLILFVAFSVMTDSAAANRVAHRYSFDGDASDSIGGADGTLVDFGGKCAQVIVIHIQLSQVSEVSDTGGQDM